MPSSTNRITKWDPTIEADDLIDDRELESIDDDRFELADFSDELARLACATRTPANIALFAPWGSGKSSLGNMLAERLNGQEGVRFARFDAFKFGETPLRKHFISQLAKSLGLHSDDKFAADMYKHVEKRDISVPKSGWARLALWFGAALLGVTCLLLLLVTIAAALSGHFDRTWSHDLGSYLLATVPVTVVLTAFIDVALGGLVVKQTKTAPSTEEEFEALFCKLVDEAKTDRLVVFIDELDRCSASEVASTLETIKTFLDVPHCVFIVAADQQVLERALRKKVRQETPYDMVNPYYSAGSAYLDKVFQYQLALPPLRSRRLTRFALSLVAGRAGVWARVENLPEVVSVLIPTHVTSPRRVKVLLNSFAIAYKLAEARLQKHMLGGELAGRASELAKLVCLRCEFPLFAEDLAAEPRYPELITMLADDMPLPDTISREIVARAHGYFNDELPVAQLLAVGAQDDHESSKRVAVGEESAETDPAGEPPAEDQSTTDGVLAQASPNRSAIRHVHGRQLVRYLQKTSGVPGPRADLIYLESAGATAGLAIADADLLERAAVDNDAATVLQLIRKMEPQDQQASIVLLADLVREAEPGLEGQNSVSMLLHVIAELDPDLSGIAEQVVRAVAEHQTRVSLRDDDLAGALSLGLNAGAHSGKWLRDLVLRHDDALRSPRVATVLVRGATNLEPAKDELLGEAAVTLLADSAGALDEPLLALTDEQAVRVLSSARTPLNTTVSDQSQDEVDNSVIPETVASLLDASLATGRRALIVASTSLALYGDHRALRGAVEIRLSGIAPVSEEALALQLLEATRPRSSSNWSNWLSTLDPVVLARVKDAPSLMAALAKMLWDRAWKSEQPDDQQTRDAALSALAQLTSVGVPSAAAPLRTAIAERLSGPFVTESGTQEQARALSVAHAFAQAGLLDSGALADIDLDCCTATLTADGPFEEPHASAIRTALVERARVSIPQASGERLDALSAALADTNKLDVCTRDTLRMIVAATRRNDDPATGSPLMPEAITARIAESGVAFDEGLTVWIGSLASGPDEVWEVMRQIASAPLSGAVSDALRRRTQSLTPAERFEYARAAIDAAPSQLADQSYFRAVRFSESDQRQAAEAIAAVANRDEAPQHEQAALFLWQQLNPTESAARSLLVRQVFLPLTSSDSGLDLVLEYFGLVAALTGNERRLVLERLHARPHPEDLQRRLDERLREAKWTTKRFKLQDRAR